MKNLLIVRTLILSFLVFTLGCENGGFETSRLSSTGQIASNQIGRLSIAVIDASGAQVYNDSNNNTSLKLKDGVNYNIQLSAPSAPINTKYQLEITRINAVTQATTRIPLVRGNNTYAPTAAGDYSWKIIATAPNLIPITQSYIADVTCSNPLELILNSNGITVQTAGLNLYNFGFSGIASGGSGNYTCALDATGVGILSHNFVNCSSGLNNVYVNYVFTRNIGVIVKDSCNTTKIVTASRLLQFDDAALVPGGGLNYIRGNNTLAQGTATNDARIDGVQYRATNSGGNNIVLAHYTPVNGAKTGSFKIIANKSYGLPSSKAFGMSLTLTGFTEPTPVVSSTGAGVIDTSNVVLSNISYSTDQNGDQYQSRSLVGNASTCTVSNVQAVVVPVTGQPCDPNNPASPERIGVTVKVSGEYSCQVSDSTGSTQIDGDFNGFENLIDSCSGGGGGGGGIVPIQL